ncbi:WD40-repeat-containing domain protein [Dichotomocladium elegans]|nr:WD40-repeat-containing domain protein [Dichotomocladium elegans]
MKAKTIEINWHDGQAIYSVDFSSDGTRFASAGADTSVRLWSIRRRVDMNSKEDNRKEPLPVHIEFLSELKRHSGPVNVVRFSPSGEYLASAGDDSCIILWKRSATAESAFGRDYAEFEKETWSVVQMFHGHNKEIYDLAWSPCGQYFITASIDNTARVWSVSSRSAIHVFTDHTHYVQGVAWDPLGDYIATQSSDRSVAVYKCQRHSSNRLQFGSAKKHLKLNKSVDQTSIRLYHDENLITFFRRLSFSPDGSFLVTPAGIMPTSVDDSEEDSVMNCAFIYPRNTIRKHPVAYTSNHNKPSIAIRWSHHPYELRPSKKANVFAMSYRLIYAVASQEAVYIYDTQQAKPLCVISGMHFAPITDVTWSHDGSILAFSSADGYCSAVVFNDNELGTLCELPTAKKQTTVLESDVAMMDIASPAPPNRIEKRPNSPPATQPLDKPKKRRIAPTLISTTITKVPPSSST